MGFSSDWLALREPVDHASRDPALLRRSKDLVARGGVVLDLGSGTGSTARAFGPSACQWRFVDGDADLLERARALQPDADCVLCDLRHIDQLPLEDVALVTASALLDLMPRDWLTALAARLRDAAIPLYAALSYNGTMRWQPEHTDDAAVTTAFNAHQRTDKGLGPALGPEAGAATAKTFAAAGFEIHQGSSPWELGTADVSLHRQLLQGIADAAEQTGLAQARQWGADRIASAPQTVGHIGHTDILALPHPTGD